MTVDWKANIMKNSKIIINLMIVGLLLSGCNSKQAKVNKPIVNKNKVTVKTDKYHCSFSDDKTTKAKIEVIKNKVDNVNITVSQTLSENLQMSKKEYNQTIKKMNEDQQATYAKDAVDELDAYNVKREFVKDFIDASNNEYSKEALNKAIKVKWEINVKKNNIKFIINIKCDKFDKNISKEKLETILESCAGIGEINCK